MQGWKRAVLLSCIGWLGGCGSSVDWRTADRSSAGLAPTPEQEPRAVYQVYVARAFGWRKNLAVHAWIASKEKNASSYRVSHVLGWNYYRGENVVEHKIDLPDRHWFGQPPQLIEELRGPAAEQAISRLKELVKAYPDSELYRLWPGPNSNTFVSHIIRSTPELGVELPPHAVGKDWRAWSQILGRSESGTGLQLSLWGLLGLTVGLAEGVEVNVLGLSLGIDFWRPALKLPFVGRLGFSDSAVFRP